VSDFDIRYHRKMLERYSGKTWCVMPATVSTALAEVRRIERARSAVLTAAGTLRLVALMALACVLMGLVQGIIGLGLFLTVGPVVALILGGLATFAPALGMDLYLRVAVIGDMDTRLSAAEECYRQRLNEVIA